MGTGVGAQLASGPVLLPRVPPVSITCNVIIKIIKIIMLRGHASGDAAVCPTCSGVPSAAEAEMLWEPRKPVVWGPGQGQRARGGEVSWRSCGG